MSAIKHSYAPNATVIALLTQESWVNETIITRVVEAVPCVVYCYLVDFAVGKRLLCVFEALKKTYDTCIRAAALSQNKGSVLELFGYCWVLSADRHDTFLTAHITDGVMSGWVSWCESDAWVWYKPLSLEDV